MQQVHVSVAFIQTLGRKKEKEFSLFAIYSVLQFHVNIFYDNKCQCLCSAKQPRDPLSS